MDTSLSLHSAVLAALSLIGGVDSRPRLGGLVTIESINGPGTICRLTAGGKLVVQMHESSLQKKISVANCQPSPRAAFALERLPITESSLDTWANLLGKFSLWPSFTYYLNFFLAFTTTSMNEHKQARSVPGFVNVPLLRAQQQQLAALRATYQLINQQRLLRRVLKMACVDTTMFLEATHDGDEEIISDQLLVQKLMHKATQPSPLKAIFTKEELEVS